MKLANSLIVLLLPLIGLTLVYWSRKEWSKRITSFNQSDLSKGLKTTKNRFISQNILLLLVLALLSLSWLRPLGEKELVQQKRKGIDIVIAFDVSESMNAEDVKPNRLERAKRELSDLLARLQGDRLALVVFAGVAFMETPLTLDYGTFNLFLNNIESGLVPINGTNIEEALSKSLEAFGVKDTDSKILKNKRSRAVLLITDGEDLEGDWRKIKDKATSTGTKLFILGIGTEKGSTIPTQYGIKRDRSGDPVISRLNTAALKDLAEQTGGKYVSVLNSDGDSIELYDKGLKNITESENSDEISSNNFHEYFQIPLAVALALWIFSRLGASFSAHIFLLLFLQTIVVARPVFAQVSELSSENLDEFSQATKLYSGSHYEEAFSKLKKLAEEFAENPDIQIALGSSAYRTGDFETASNAFLSAATTYKDQSKQASSLYNLGNAQVQLEKFTEAVQSYKEAKKLAPLNADIDNNLKYAEKLLKEQQQEQEQRKQEKQNKDNQSKENESKDSSDSEKSKPEDSSESDSGESNDGEKSDKDSESKQDQKTEEEDNSKSGESPPSEEEEQQESPEEGGGKPEEQDGPKEEPTEDPQGGAEPEEPKKDKEGSADDGASNDDNPQGENPGNGSQNTGDSSEEEAQYILESMLGAVEENPKKSRQFRARKAIQKMKRENKKIPKLDW